MQKDEERWSLSVFPIGWKDHIFSDWKAVKVTFPEKFMDLKYGLSGFTLDWKDDLFSFTERQKRWKDWKDDSSLFSLIVDQIRSARELNSDMENISEWAHQWKMSFNPDPTKQAVEVYFTRKRNPPQYLRKFTLTIQLSPYKIIKNILD